MMVRGGLGVAAALALVLLPGLAPAASFDCAKARTADERLICGDPELSRADERMATAYKALMDGVQAQGLDGAVRDRLRGEQRAWVGRRNTQCGITASTKLGPDNRPVMTDCLRETVGERIAHLERLHDGLPVSALATPQRITETNATKRFRIDAAYPVLPASVAGADGFNALSEQRARSVVERFRRESLDEVPETDSMSELEISYELAFASPRLVSVQFSVYGYVADAAHGNRTSHALHVDLGKRKALTAADVFLPGSGWEKAIAEHALAELTREVRAREVELFDEAGAGLPGMVSDLTNWRLEADRAFITFDPYAVAAYAVGTLEVAVPYALLRPYLKPDGPLPPRRS